MDGSIDTPPLERLYTLRELVEQTGLTVKVLRRAINSGWLRAVQPSGFGGALYVSASDYLQWLDNTAVSSREAVTIGAAESSQPDVAFDFEP